MSGKSQSQTPFQPLFEPDFEHFYPSHNDLLHFRILRSLKGAGQYLGLTYPDLPPEIVVLMGRELEDSPFIALGKTRSPLLANSKISYFGEPVGVIGSKNEASLESWSNRIQILVSPYSQGEQNKVSRSRKFSHGTVSEDLLEKALWVHGEYSLGSQDPCDILPLEATANVHKGCLYLRGLIQWPQALIQNLSRLTGLPGEKIFFLNEPGAFSWNNRMFNSLHHLCLAGFLSYRYQQPIHLSCSPQEAFDFGPKRPDAVFRFKTALDLKGNILSLQAQATIQVGARPVYEQEILDRAVIGLVSLYQTKHLSVSIQGILSPTPPRAPLGGWGENLGLAALEAHVQDITTALGQEVHEWKLAHLQKRLGEPFLPPDSKDPNHLPAMIQEVLRVSDFPLKSASYALQFQRREHLKGLGLPFLGIGLSLGFQGNGFLSSETAPMNLVIRMETSGHITVFLPFPFSSSYMEEQLRQLISKQMSLKPSQVHFSQAWSSLPGDSGPATLSRSLTLFGRMFSKTLETLSKKRFQSPLPLEVKKVFRRKKNSTWDDDNFHGIPFIDRTWGVCATEIEVSPVHGKVKIRKITLCIEAGPILYPENARHALIQSLLLGLGWTRETSINWDISGQLAPGTYMRYTIPSYKLLGEIEILFFGKESGEPKGLGTLAGGLLSSAILSGIRMALGNALRSIPIPLQTLQEAIDFHES